MGKNFKEYVPPEDLERKRLDDNRKRKYKTGVVMVIDEDGEVFISRNTDSFQETLEREALDMDIVYMCHAAIEKIRGEKTMRFVLANLERVIQNTMGDKNVNQ